jgi:hypothetical protein
MPGRRETMRQDRLRNSRTRKDNARKLEVTQKEQASVLARLVARAKEEAKA